MNLGTVNLGIDASNIRQGGGVTHLSMLLNAANPERAGIRKVVVWSIAKTLEAIADRPWLEKRGLGIFEKNPLGRVLWQQAVLPWALKRAGCDILFSPGGTISMGAGVPVVTMSQNLLPFDKTELRRYGMLSARWIKMRILRLMQGMSIRKADGVVFLTQYAKQAVEHAVGRPATRSTVIPHGIEPRFFSHASDPLSRPSVGPGRPFKVLYVSIVDLYKHQWKVAEAVVELRRCGLPIELDLIGPAYPPAMPRLVHALDRLDPDAKFIRYLGPVAFDELHEAYAGADAFVFASSCENLPNILIEAMAAGLPIACSNRGPMPEVLGDAGVYFDPERPREIADSIRVLYQDPSLRRSLAVKARERARGYSWERCARETAAFIVSVAREQ